MVLFFSGYKVALGFVNTDGGVFSDKKGDFGAVADWGSSLLFAETLL